MMQMRWMKGMVIDKQGDVTQENTIYEDVL